jgi:hypothetical protein
MGLWDRPTGDRVTFDWLEMSPDDIREEADKADLIARSMEQDARSFRAIAAHAREKADQKEQSQRGRDA